MHPFLQNLATQVPSWVRIVGQSDTQLVVVALANLPDGRYLSYNLSITVEEIEAGQEGHRYQCVQVREQDTNHLPRFCPDRHIDVGGYFCMGYNEPSLLFPRTSSEARSWWATLAGFLLLQRSAKRTGIWQAEDWPHGHQAAQKALEVSRILQSFPSALLSELGNPQRKKFRLKNRRKPCPCGSGRPIRACHEKLANKLVTLPKEIQDAEANAMEVLQASEMTCCGTMKGCPLSKGNKQFFQASVTPKRRGQ